MGKEKGEQEVKERGEEKREGSIGKRRCEKGEQEDKKRREERREEYREDEECEKGRG